MMDHPEPWKVAAAREHGAVDAIAIAILAAGALVWALTPPARLVALTGLRLAVAAIMAGASVATSGIVASVFWFAASGFAFLALFSIAGHIEAAALGPLVDRIAGKEHAP